MNTEIVAQIIAEALQERPEFAGVPVWEPTDGEKEGDKALLVNVTGADEIISGNFTYQISGEIMYRQRYAEAEPAALVLDVTAFSRACAEVMAALAGRRNGPGRARRLGSPGGVIIPRACRHIGNVHGL